VRARGVARRADITNDLTLGDMFAHRDVFAIFAQVQISRRIGGVVTDFDGVASPTLVAFFDDHSIAYRNDGCARRCSVVNTGVGANSLEDGVTAGVGEFGGYTFVVKGCFEESFFERFAFTIVVGAIEVEGFLPFSAVVEIGGVDASDADALLLDIVLVVVDAYTVAFLQTEEVDGPGIYLGEFEGEVDGEVLCHHSVPEAGFDDGLSLCGYGVDGFDDSFDMQAILQMEDDGLTGIFEIDPVGELLESTGIGVVEGVVGLAGAYLAVVEFGAWQGTYLRYLQACSAEIVEYTTEGLSVAYEAGVDAEGIDIETELEIGFAGRLITFPTRFVATSHEA